MSLSSLFEEKFDERKNNYFLSSSEEEDKEEDKKEGAKNETMESQQRKILRKNSRLGFSTKKKVHTKLLPSSQERTTKRALEGVRVCVCV